MIIPNRRDIFYRFVSKRHLFLLRHDIHYAYRVVITSQFIIKRQKTVNISISDAHYVPNGSKEQREPFESYESLTKYLEQFHDVSINESTLYFRNLVEFETWRGLENREVDYVCYRRNKGSNGEEHIYYYCNRSNIKAFISSCEKRSMKCGGSIHILGVCPSKITVKVCKDGLVMVKYVETHTGHNDELRTKRLSKVEEHVGQLTARVTKDRVLEDAGIITNGKLERINLITRGDLAYLTRKFNIDKQRDADMVATALKIEEWNKEGKNQALQSYAVSEKFYIASYNEFCDVKCRALYCNKCKICNHRYQCECPDYTIKTVMCKHIHAVALFEQRSDSVLDFLDSSEDDDVDASHIDQPTTNQSNYHEELNHYIEEKKGGQTFNQGFEENKILLAEINDFARLASTLDKEFSKELLGQFRKFKNNWQQRNGNTCRKRKIEKQLYYPNKK